MTSKIIKICNYLLTSNNLFKLSNDTLIPVYYLRHEEWYAENLGLIYKDDLVFEYETAIELASYIKGGDDTTVLISSVEKPVLIAKSISVYPNPAGNVLNINIYNPGGDNVNINIIDLQGKVWYEGNTKSDVKELNISSLPAGMYIVQLALKENIMQQKFIKN